MKDRLKHFSAVPAGLRTPRDAAAARQPVVAVVDERREAETALIALGYKPAQATQAIEQASRSLDAEASAEALIRLALRSMIS